MLKLGESGVAAQLESNSIKKLMVEAKLKLRQSSGNAGVYITEAQLMLSFANAKLHANKVHKYLTRYLGNSQDSRPPRNDSTSSAAQA